MFRASRKVDPWFVVPAAVTMVAWTILALGVGLPATPVLCAANMWSADVPLELTLMLASPSTLALGWAVMLVAMMTPLVVDPLRHVCARSFARRRPRACVLFVTGYALVWMAAGAALRAGALLLQGLVGGSLACVALVAALALLWQVSPAKQWCLNRCHRKPSFAAFGAAADRDIFLYGVAIGSACVGTCWALMLLPLVAPRGHVLLMAGVALFIFAERLESPAPLAWKWRGTGKAMRILKAQFRIRLVNAGTAGRLNIAGAQIRFSPGGRFRALLRRGEAAKNPDPPRS